MELGATSFDFISLIGLFSKKMDVSFSFAELRKHTALLSLVSLVEEKSAHLPHDIASTEVKEPIRANPQQTVYFNEWNEYNSIDEVLQAMLKLEKNIDVDRLVSSIKKAADIHSGIFARFEEKDGDVYLLPPSKKEILVEVFELKEKELQSVLEPLTQSLMKPQDDYFLFRIFLTESHVYLFMRFAHVLGDANSVEIFIQDLLQTYEEKEVKNEKMSIWDYCAELNSVCASPEYKNTVLHYKKQFKEVQKWTDIPGDRAEKKITYASITKELSVPFATVTALCKTLSVSANVLFAGLFALILSKRSIDDAKTCFLFSHNGRTDARIMDTFGFFTTGLPVSVETAPENTRTSDHEKLKSWFLSLQNQLVAGMSQSVLPLDWLTETYPEFFDYLYIFQPKKREFFLNGKSVPTNWFEDDEEGYWESPIPIGENKGEDDAAGLFSKLSLQVFEKENSFALEMSFLLNLYSRDFIESFISDIEKSLKSLVQGMGEEI